MTSYSGERAIVIGGSIGGLTTALLLRDAGFDVTIFERTPAVLDGRGSGIVLQPDTLRWFTERSTKNPAQQVNTSHMPAPRPEALPVAVASWCKAMPHPGQAARDPAPSAERSHSGYRRTQSGRRTPRTRLRSPAP